MQEQEARWEHLGDIMILVGLGVAVILLVGGVWLILLGRRVDNGRAGADRAEPS
jgi:hypothetical protein